MPTTKEIEEANSRVAQSKLILNENFIKNKYNQKFIFEKIKNINCRILATDYLQLHHATWIGNTVFHFAVENMDLAAVDVLLSHGADFTIKNSNGSTALHQLLENKPNLILEACDSDDSFVDFVVSAHVKYSNFENPMNSYGLSHFHVACAVNNVEVVKGFLQNGVSVDHAVKPDSPIFPGFTPLHFAAKNCSFDVAEILLSRGASVQKKNIKGISPVHTVLERKLDLISKLHSSGTMIDRADKLLGLFLKKESKNDMIAIDDWGLSHLHIACTLRDSKLAASLFQKVVNINHFVNMDSLLWPGFTALHFASLCKINTVKLLMKNGADINAKDAKGVTPFDICIKKYKAEDIYAILTLHPIWKNTMLSDGKTKVTDFVFAMRNLNQFDGFLKKLSKNFNIYNSSLWPGYTPMHLAVMFSKDIAAASEADEDLNLKLLKNLYKHNPTMLSSKDVHGYTPLHLAFRLNKKPALHLLLEFLNLYPNLTNHVDEDNLSLVHIACAQNRTDVLKRLLSMGSNVNTAYKGKSLTSPVVYSGSTPLHIAVINGSVETVEMLMKKGANLYTKDANCMTPIHLLLLNPAASTLLTVPNLQDSVVHGIGLSHLHVVCWWDCSEIAKSLLNLGANINGIITYQSTENTKKSELSFMERFNGYTPLLMAYEESNYETVEELLKRGADVFVADAEGKALLYRILEYSNSDTFYEMFAAVVTERIDVQTRLKADTGMTALHIACLNVNDFQNINKLLSRGANVNVQIRADSPIFKGFTPLHVVLHTAKEYGDEIVDRTIELLIVEADADVTLQAENSKTAVYMAWESFQEEPVDEAEPQYIRTNKLLEAQRDFSMNPTNVDGLSHFHIACGVCNTGIARKFLRDADIDINQPTDFFRAEFSGYSALHFAAGSPAKLCGASKQLRMLDLLLNYGVNVHIVDKHGETPLHECARFNSLDLFERLVRGGADLNARNVLGNTPLYYYLRSDNASVDGLKLLLRFGCHLNISNAITGECYMGVAACKFSHADMRSFLDCTIINFKQEIEPDDLGRTVIHNIVSTNSSKVSATEYADFIGQLSENDLDVDAQDHLGETALHKAARFHNLKGIAGLLMAGADVNTMDVNGKTAFTYDFDTCSLCSSYKESTDEANDENDEDDQMCEHLQIKQTLAIHVKKLQYCGLDVNKQNEDLACKAFEVFGNKTKWSEEFFEEIEAVKTTTIGLHSVTLHDFLSENRAVADYPTMSLMKREAIDRFFSIGERESLRAKFPELFGILQLQFKKAVSRPLLVESAKNAMAFLIGFRLPEICSHYILTVLKNSELKSLISSTN